MAFNSANTYASVDALKARVSRWGYVWGSDVDDADGYVEPSGSVPETTYAEESLEYANQLIDEALAPHVPIVPRPVNGWLSDRAVDVAAARFFGLGGKEVPKTLADAAADALERLAAVRDWSLKVPGLDYAIFTSNGRRAGRPVVAINIR